MKAKSINGKSAEEVQLALEQSMADGYKPTIAIVFISIGKGPTYFYTFTG